MDIKVTNKLAEILKLERQNHTISAKDLSQRIGKSPSYISTLERGKIEYIDSDLFYNLIRKIKLCSDAELVDYINNIAYKSFVDVKFNKKKFSSEKWIYQLTLYLRQSQLNTHLNSIIQENLRELNISGKDLVRKINNNEFLEQSNDEKYNTLNIDDDGNWLFKYKLNDDFVDNIINENVTTTNYINMFAIIFNLYILQGDNFKIANEKSEKLLSKFNFLSLSEIIKTKQKFIDKKIETISNGDYSFELFSMEKDVYYNNLKNIRNYMEELMVFKPETALIIADTTNKNLELDAEFMNMIYKIPFGSILKNVNKEGKQEFLNRMSKLMTDVINNYKDEI